MRDRVLLFDIDQTLILGAGAGRRALEAAVRAATGRRADLSRVPFAGRMDPLITRDLLRSSGVEPAAAVVEAVLASYATLLPSEVAASPGEVLPGVPALLDRLAPLAHVHVGLLTGNVAAGARVKLAAHGLWERFSFGAFGADAESRPALLPVALSRWRATTQGAARSDVAIDMARVYVIGDTVHDVEVAKAWGARAVAVGTGVRSQPREALLASGPDLFFEDLSHAAPLVAELTEGT